MAKALLGEKLFTKLMKATFYGHFVAGEDEVQITPVLDRLRQFGVKPILDYSVEEDISQEEAERREIQWVNPSSYITLLRINFCFIFRISTKSSQKHELLACVRRVYHLILRIALPFNDRIRFLNNKIQSVHVRAEKKSSFLFSCCSLNFFYGIWWFQYSKKLKKKKIQCDDDKCS